MKQIRKISNMIAEELQNALDEQGISLDESAFEERVSEIVMAIDEAVNEESITEDDKFYFAASECSIGGVAVKEGEFVELEDTDEGKIATIYDEDGEVRKEGVVVKEDDDLDSLEEIEDEDEEAGEVDEIANKADRRKAAKFLKKGKTATGNKKLKGAALSKFLKSHKNMFKGAARKKAAKTFKKTASKHLNNGAVSGTVTESFDIHSEGITFTVEAGDVITMEDGMISVVREGRTVISGIEVSEGFFDRCYEAAVLDEGKKADECGDGEKCDPEECDKSKANEGEEGEANEEANEAAILTFKADKGYVLVREGKELPMGNRVRARATLVSEGINITSAQLDAASKGQLVTL